MPDHGEFTVNVNPETGAITVSVREPMAIRAQSVVLDPFTFIGIAAGATQVVAGKMQQAAQQMMRQALVKS